MEKKEILKEMEEKPEVTKKLALVFKKGENSAKAIRELKPKSVVTVDGTTFLLFDENLDLRKGYSIPKKWEVNVKLVVVKQEDIFIANKLLRCHEFLCEKMNPLQVEHNNGELIRDFVIIDPDTNFYCVDILAWKIDKMSKMMVGSCHVFEFGEDDENTNNNLYCYRCFFCRDGEQKNIQKLNFYDANIKSKFDSYANK